MGIGCLIKDTQLKKDIEDLVFFLANDNIANNKSASVTNIYKQIRDLGIEADLQTIGAIYKNVLPKNKGFDTDDEVDDVTNKTLSDKIHRAAITEKKGEKQIGDEAPEREIVERIFDLFFNLNAEDKTTISGMRQMQDALWKGIQRKLKKQNKPTTTKGWKDILSEALKLETLGLRDLQGNLNSINDLFDAMQGELEAASVEFGKKADVVTQARFEQMVADLKAASYSILLSKAEARKVLDDMMKEAGFSKTLKNGKVILDWNKLSRYIGSSQAVEDNVEEVLRKNNYPQSTIDSLKLSLKNEFIDFYEREKKYRASQLDTRQKAIGREIETKTDMRRLAELESMGIFDNAYRKLLNNTIGVSDLEQADLDDLEILAKAASGLFKVLDKKKLDDSDVITIYQEIQRRINSIVARNINSKNKLLKALSWVNNYFSVYLTSLLTAPINITQNALSGLMAAITPNLTEAVGKVVPRLNASSGGFKKANKEMYWAMINDISFNSGSPFGNEIGDFAPKELWVQDLKFNPKDNGGGAIGYGKTMLNVALFLAKAGLVALDSSNKVILTNKILYNVMYNKLISNGMNKRDALLTLNQALFGQSWEQAKLDALEMIEEINKLLPPNKQLSTKDSMVSRTANDLVKSNLAGTVKITKEQVKAAYQSSYHVAGTALGHEPNNYVSKKISLWRQDFAQKEKKLIKDKNWNDLAIHRLTGLFYNNFIIRFTGGATNWIVLKLESDSLLGLRGLALKPNRDLDFGSDISNLKYTIEKQQKARNMIGRSMMGVAYTAVFALAKYLIMDDEDEEKKAELEKLKAQRDELEKSKKEYSSRDMKKSISENIQSLNESISKLELETNMYKRIEQSYYRSKLYKQFAPDLYLFYYYKNTDKSNVVAIFDYLNTRTRLGNNYGDDVMFKQAEDLAKKGNYDAAMGIVGSMVGGRIGVPLWKTYTVDIPNLGKWISGKDVTSTYQKPSEFTEGVLGGGFLEAFGLWKRNSNVTILRGVGSAGFEALKEDGIERISDIIEAEKNGKQWWDVLGKSNGEKAKKDFDEWVKQNSK